MTASDGWSARRLLRIAIALLLLASGLLGAQSGVADVGSADSPARAAAAAVELLYAVLGVLAAPGLVLRRPWASLLVPAWAVAATATAALAPVVWGSAGAGAAVAAGGLTAAVAGAIAWAARWSLSDPGDDVQEELLAEIRGVIAELEERAPED